MTQLNINVDRAITPEQCFNIGQECIKNLLCKVTTCIQQDDGYYLEWVWQNKMLDKILELSKKYETTQKEVFKQYVINFDIIHKECNCNDFIYIKKEALKLTEKHYFNKDRW